MIVFVRIKRIIYIWVDNLSSVRWWEKWGMRETLNNFIKKLKQM